MKIALSIIVAFLVLPLWGVYYKQMQGYGELRRQTLLAEAEVARARGLAEANDIAKDLGKDGYLRYLWLKSIDRSKTIYVPTEANIPLLEVKQQQGAKQ